MDAWTRDAFFKKIVSRLFVFNTELSRFFLLVQSVLIIVHMNGIQNIKVGRSWYEIPEKQRVCSVCRKTCQIGDILHDLLITDSDGQTSAVILGNKCYRTYIIDLLDLDAHPYTEKD